MKPLNSLTKRDLLAARKFDPDDVRAYAEQFFSEERFGDAFEFYRKLDDEEGILKIKKAAMELGDPELLWRVEHHNPARVTREDWLRCGEQAMSHGQVSLGGVRLPAHRRNGPARGSGKGVQAGRRSASTSRRTSAGLSVASSAPGGVG